MGARVAVIRAQELVAASARLPNWRARLQLWANQNVGQQFRWGVTDCAMLCFHAYTVMTGRKLDMFTGAWSSALSAARYQRVNSTDTAKLLLDQGCEEVESFGNAVGDFIIVPGRVFLYSHVSLGSKMISSAPGRSISFVMFQGGRLPRGTRILRVV